MKTAISIPDPVFRSAERLAKRMGLSRSRFFSRAVASFIQEHQSADVKAALDRVYGAEPSRLDEGLARSQKRALSRSFW